VFSYDTFQKGLDRGAFELLQLLMHFMPQGLFLTCSQLKYSGGLLKLLLNIFEGNEKRPSRPLE